MKQKTKIITISLVSLLLLGGVGAFIYAKNHVNDSTAVRGVNSVNYDKPTKQEQAAGDEQKTRNVAQSDIENKPAADIKAATVILVDGNQYDDTVEVRAYIANIFETGGICKATFTQAGQNDVVATSNATASATTTQCASIDVPISQFPMGGTWKLAVSYSSATATGSTDSNVTIRK